MCPTDANELIARVAARQHGRVAAWQLLDLGIDREAIKTARRSRRLRTIYPGVYSVPGAGNAPEARWMAGLLAGGRGATLVLETAASVRAVVRSVLLRPIHVNSLTHRQNHSGLIFHRLALGDADVMTWNGLRITTPLRTLEDLRGRTPRAVWEALVVDAVAKGIVSREALSLFRVAAPLTRSALERIARRLITEHRLPEPKVNHEVMGRERDLVWPGHKVVVEVDGPHHLLPSQVSRDNRRDRELALDGWVLLRYREEELLQVPADLRALLMKAP